MNQYREDTPEFQQLEAICLNRLSEQYLSLIKESVQNNRIEEAKDLMSRYRKIFGINKDTEQLFTELLRPTWILKMKLSMRRLSVNLRNMTVLSGIKMLLFGMVLCILGAVWITLIYGFLLQKDLFIELEETALVILLYAPVGITSIFIGVVFNYVIQNRITQYRMLEDKYSKIEIVGLLILSLIISPLFYYYLYRLGYPIWRNTMLIALVASVCTFILPIIGIVLSLVYLVKLYKTAKEYNL